MASSVVETISSSGAGGVVTISLACTDAAAASFDNYTLKAINTNFLRDRGYSLQKIQTIPGGVPPVDDTDMTLLDAVGADLLGGNGANKIDNATINEFTPIVGGVPSTQPVLGALTLHIANQTTNSATFTINLIFTKEQ